MYQESELEVVLQCTAMLNGPPSHHGMVSPQAAHGGESLQIWKVVAKILHKQSPTADEGRSSSLGIMQGANNSLL
jgi:hypothetical protein